MVERFEKFSTLVSAINKYVQKIEADEIEMLEDMIVVALNEAMKKVDKDTEEKMGKFAQGMPGLF